VFDAGAVGVAKVLFDGRVVKGAEGDGDDVMVMMCFSGSGSVLEVRE